MRDPARDPEWYCSATAKSTGQACSQRAGWGTNHPGTGLCKSHGGSSPGGRTQAARILAGKFAELHAVDVHGADAVEQLQHALERAAGRVLWLRRQVEDLNPEDLWRGTTLVRRTVDAQGVETVTSEAKPGKAMVWRVLMEEEDRLRAVARDLAHVKAVMTRLAGPGAADVEREAEEIVAQVLDLAPVLRQAPRRQGTSAGQPGRPYLTRPDRAG